MRAVLDHGPRVLFQVLGMPVGKGRGRAVRTHTGVRVVTPTSTREWEHLCAHIGSVQAYKQGWPRGFSGPVKLTVWAIAARPKRLLRKKDPVGRLWRSAKPDVDNVVKAVSDALVAGGVIHDDVQVCQLDAQSLYAAIGEGPSVCITLEQVETDGPPSPFGPAPTATPRSATARTARRVAA